jgi:hypothetical protein
MSPVSSVLNFHKLARVGFKVIVGALESDPSTRDIPVEFVDHRASLTDAMEGSWVAAKRWSWRDRFTSPDTAGRRGVALNL